MKNVQEMITLSSAYLNGTVNVSVRKEGLQLWQCEGLVSDCVQDIQDQILRGPHFPR